MSFAKKLGLCVTLTLGFAMSQARADLFDVSILGGVSVTDQQVSFSNPQTTTSRNYLMAGAQLNIPLPFVGFGLTTGLWYLEMGAHYNFTSGLNTYDYDLKIPYLFAPITVDWWLVPNILAVGAGFYLATPIGYVTENGTQTVSFSAPLPYSVTELAGDAGFASIDLGGAIHAQGKFPLGSGFFATAGLWYVYGFTNASTTNGASVHNNSFIANGGVGMSF